MSPLKNADNLCESFSSSILSLIIKSNKIDELNDFLFDFSETAIELRNPVAVAGDS
ncbi:Uncharacterised protein [Chlamydia trachomatis]|nr:Uncharacterised protein [Chlamydia trachomatis]